MRTPIGLLLASVIGAAFCAVAIWDEPAQTTPKGTPQELQASTSPLPVQQGKPNLPEAGGKHTEPRNSAPVLAPERVGSASTAPAGKISEPGTEFVDSIDHEPATEPSIAPPAEASPLPLGFGEFASVEGISVANWKELAATHRDLAVGWSAIVKNYLLGGPTDGSAWAQMIGGYNKLQDFGARVRGKLPSHVSNKNGELTHPLVMANLLVGELEEAGCPLTADQRQKLATLGEDFEKHWKWRQGLYTGATLKLEMVLDEVELKQWFMDGMLALLTQEQRNTVVDPQTQGIFCAELFNSGILLHCQCEFVPAASRVDLKSLLLDRLAGLWKVERVSLENNAWILDAWLDQIGSQVEPAESGRWAMAWTNDVVICARGYMDMLHNYMRVLDINVETREAMRQNSWFFIPRVPR